MTSWFLVLKKTLPTTIGLLLSATTYQASAAKYYNCNHEDGCTALDSTWQIGSPDNYTQTKNPIVLAHGALVFNRVLGINSFHRIPDELSFGGATVFQTLVPAINSTEVRAEIYLRPQLEEALAVSGATQLNLIGHSQGGLDSRYISHTSDYVASVTSISTPHSGNIGMTQAAKRLQAFDEEYHTRLFDAYAAAVNMYGNTYQYLTGVDLEQSYYNQMESTTITALSDFNTTYPNGYYGDCTSGKDKPSRANDDVHYFSIGNYGWLTNAFDPLDALLFISGSFQTDERHDGLVETCGMYLGKMIRDDYYLNHVDSANHLFGLKSWRAPNVISIYRNHAARLKTIGK